MGHQTRIVCDQCDAKAPVPGVNAVPAGWIVARAAFPQEGAPSSSQPATYCFCSWRCTAMYAQTMDAQGVGEPQAQIHMPQQGILTPTGRM